MDPLFNLLLACAVFLLLHIVPSSPLRGAAVRAIGENAYLGLFSLVSLAAIVWMAIAYGRAPVSAPLWPGLTLLPAILMPFAFIFVMAGVLTPNPTAVAQGSLLTRPDPAHGIIRVTRHPVMWGILLWSGAHLLARGEMKATIFFGSFAALAAAGTLLQDARKSALHGEDWKRFAQITSNVPFLAIAQGRNRFVWREIGIRRVGLALIAYGGTLYLHGNWFGVQPY